jgi:hypothetical protein
MRYSASRRPALSLFATVLSPPAGSLPRLATLSVASDRTHASSLYPHNYIESRQLLSILDGC